MTPEKAYIHIRKTIFLLGRSVFVMLFCLAYSTISAKSSKVDSLSLEVASLKYQITEKQHLIESTQNELMIFEKELEYIYKHTENANEDISNLISASSHIIQVWGWVISAIAILLSIFGVAFAFVTNKLRKNIALLTSQAMSQLKQAEIGTTEIAEQQAKISIQQEEIKKMQSSTEAKIQELQNIYSNIQENSQEIYRKLRREETIALLERLENVPDDIVNIADIMLARDLEESDFSKLFNAYQKLIIRYTELYNAHSVAEIRKNNSLFAELEGSYSLQFAQHFMGQSILKPEIRDLVCPRFFVFFNKCFFRNDAEKSTKDFKKGVLLLDNIQQQIEISAEFIDAIAKSRYSRLTELYQTLLSDLNEKQLKGIWDAVSIKNSNAVFFANTFKDIIININPTSTLLEDVDKYIKGSESA